MLVIMESNTSKTILNTVTVLRIKYIRNILPYISTKEKILGIVTYDTTLITPFRIPSEIIDIHEIFTCFDIATISQLFTIGTFKTIITIGSIHNMITYTVLYLRSFKITLWLSSNPGSDFGNQRWNIKSF
jgi:hypothetical protein